MQQIRCLLACSNPSLLTDVIQTIVNDHLSLSVVKRIEQGSELISEMSKGDYNVVILDMDDSNWRLEMCEKLLEQYPHLVAVGIGDDGKFLDLIIKNPGPREFTQLIRQALASKTQSL